MAHLAEVAAGPEEGHGIPRVGVSDLGRALAVGPAVDGGVVGALDGLDAVDLAHDTGLRVRVRRVPEEFLLVDPHLVHEAVRGHVGHRQQREEEELERGGMHWCGWS